MNTQLLKARQTRYAAYATVYTLLILTAVVIANVLADRYDKSFDATANKRYTPPTSARARRPDGNRAT